MNEIVWEQTDSPVDNELTIVDDGLDAANRSAVEVDSVRPLACFARLESGELIGGAIARTWGECCELRQLWVAPPHRRRGIGRRLLEMVETEARQRDCTLIFLETFSFQAPQLYERAGFEVVCEFRGFPAGVSKLIQQKVIAADVPKNE